MKRTCKDVVQRNWQELVIQKENLAAAAGKAKIMSGQICMRALQNG